MSERSRDFEQALRRLRAEYRAELPGRLDSLGADLTRAREEGSAEALRTARQHTHTLKGTSGSYGLDGVSQALEVAERALDRLLADPEAAGAWGELEGALERARGQLAT